MEESLVRLQKWCKKKLIRNRRNIEIVDGGMKKLNFLSDLEQKVVDISGLEKSIKAVDGKVQLSFEENKNSKDDDYGDQSSMNNDDLEDLLNRDCSIDRSIRADSEDRLSQYDTKIEESVSLLKSQISLQKNVYESLSNWSKQSEQNQRKITNDLKKKFIEEFIALILYKRVVFVKCNAIIEKWKES